ncbi:MAG: DUF402 domain-containing protein [Thermomicrobiales bacterium]
MSKFGYTWPQRPNEWHHLRAGTNVTIVKRNDQGADVISYPGLIVPTKAEAPWVEIEAIWTAGTVVQADLTFETGDVLREFFSWQHPFNAFALYSRWHELKGWYANVTLPSWVELRDNALIMVWQDLWLDVVATPGNAPVHLDDDELEDSGLTERDRDLFDAIIRARDELLILLESGSGPFSPSRF